MADLLAKNESKAVVLTRTQEVSGTIISVTDNEFIIDLGSKAEGVIYRKELNLDDDAKLKVGSKVTAYVVIPENESGQAILTMHKSGQRAVIVSPKWQKFESAIKSEQVFVGKGLEVNKGGVIVELNGVRGFLPSSQVLLTHAANLEALIGQDIEVTIIEVDPTQNRLIFTQKAKVNEETKANINKLKVGDKVSGQVAAVLAFGIFVTLAEGVEGLVHISEISWDKADDASAFKVGDQVEAKVVAADANTGRVNLSIKQLTADPFAKIAEDYQADDVIKATITKVTTQGVSFSLKDGVEGFMAAAKMDASAKYEVGESANYLVDNVDMAKRRVNLAPFLTSTEGLIYK